MKKRSLLSIVLIGMLFLIMPFTVQAKEPVTIYFFHGDGCSYCASAEKFFETLKKDNDYKDKFIVREFEVWKNKSNESIMAQVAKKRGDKADGVPYFLIGEKSWNGYSASYNDAIKDQILKIYNNENYVDDIAEIIGGKQPEEKDSSIITISIIAGVVVIVGIALYFARKSSDDELEEDVVEEKIVKKEVEVKKVSEIKEKDTTLKNSTNKKSEVKKTSTPKKTTSNGTKKKNTAVKKNTTNKKTSKK